MHRRLLVTLAVSGLLLAGTAGPAAAHEKADHKGGPPAHVVKAQAERLCENNHGTFIDLDGLAYVCLLPTGATVKEIRQAQRLCERQGGALFVAVGNVAYACVLPGFSGPVTHLPTATSPGFVLDTGGLRILPIVVG